MPVVRRELTAAGDGGEVLVAGSLGLLLDRASRHRRARRRAGDARRWPSPARSDDGPDRPSLSAAGTLDRPDRARPRPSAVPERPPDRRHPGASGRDGNRGASPRSRGRCCPGSEVVELEDVELLAPFKFYRDEPRTLDPDRAAARRRRRHAPGGLRADRPPRAARAGRAGDAPFHRPGTAGPQGARRRRKSSTAPGRYDTADAGVGHEAVYGVYFHGPAYQVLDRAWRDDGHVVGRLAGELPDDHDPASQPTELAPRLIELCFQTAGVWELGNSRPDGAADARRPGRAIRREQEAGPAVGGCEPPIVTGQTLRSSMNPAGCGCAWRAIGRSSCPGRSRPVPSH